LFCLGYNNCPFKRKLLLCTKIFKSTVLIIISVNLGVLLLSQKNDWRISEIEEVFEVHIAENPASQLGFEYIEQGVI